MHLSHTHILTHSVSPPLSLSLSLFLSISHSLQILYPPRHCIVFFRPHIVGPETISWSQVSRSNQVLSSRPSLSKLLLGEFAKEKFLTLSFPGNCASDVKMSTNNVAASNDVEIPTKSKSLRAKSIQKRIETERNKTSPRGTRTRVTKSGGNRRDQNGYTMSKYRRRAANAKERDRMKLVNEAFERLRDVVPEVPENPILVSHTHNNFRKNCIQVFLLL